MKRTADEMLAQIQEQRRRLNERAHKIQARRRKQERASETRQKVLLGAFLRSWMSRDEDIGRRAMAGLEHYLTRDIDRVHFGLELRGDGTIKDGPPTNTGTPDDPSSDDTRAQAS